MSPPDAKGRSALRCYFIYDWYDGPTAGVGLNYLNEPVFFQEIAREDARSSFIFFPLSPTTYDGLERRYGRPPEYGTVIEWDDCSAAVESALTEARLATRGVHVVCAYSVSMEILSESEATAAQLAEAKQRLAP